MCLRLSSVRLLSHFNSWLPVRALSLPYPVVCRPRPHVLHVPERVVVGVCLSPLYAALVWLGISMCFCRYVGSSCVPSPVELFGLPVVFRLMMASRKAEIESFCPVTCCVVLCCVVLCCVVLCLTRVSPLQCSHIVLLDAASVL